MTDGSVIRMIGLNKTYLMGEVQVCGLKDIDFTVEHGDFIAVMGPSGSGKSTLMNVIGLLDQPDSGDYYLDGVEVSTLDDNRRSSIQARR